MTFCARGILQLVAIERRRPKIPDNSSARLQPDYRLLTLTPIPDGLSPRSALVADIADCCRETCYLLATVAGFGRACST